jgi:hypothetical protein
MKKAFLFILLSLFFTGCTKLPSTTQISNPAPSPLASPISSSIIKLSEARPGWKTYLNEDEKISFDFPAELEVREFKDLGISLWNSPAPSNIPEEAPFPPVQIMTADKAELNGSLANIWIGELNNLKKKKITVGGILTTEVTGNIASPVYYSNDEIKYVDFTKNNKEYLIRIDTNLYKGSSKDFELILSTFKFLN